MWRKTQARLYPQLEDLVALKNISSSAEDEILVLPSDIDRDDHHKLGLESAASYEFQLWEGEANEAVTMICNTVLHGMVLRDAKKMHARGVYQNTCASKYIKTVTKKKEVAMARYRNARRCLLALTPKPDMKTTQSNYPELKDEDAYAKNATSARKVGDGSTLDSWLWTFGHLKGLNDGQKAEFILESA